jgi:monofunctional biosynthetic peptidoglycan transglycosylase
MGPIEKISKHLPMAVKHRRQPVPTHNGFDMIEIKSHERKRNPQKKRGASTISQQTAKNVFLCRVPHGLEKDLKSTYSAHRASMVQRANHGSLSQFH